MVGGMDICQRIDIEVAATFRAGLPSGWGDDPVLGHFTDAQRIIMAVRRSTFASDAAGLALLSRGEPESRLLLMAAALPFALKECGGEVRERIDDVVSELALVIDAVGDRPVNRRGRRLVVALVDLAYDRLRKRERRARTPLPLAEEHPVWGHRRVGVWAEEEALARLTVFEIRRQLSSDPRIAAKAERLWDTAATLVEEGSLSQQDRNRLGHARRQLRQWVDPRLVA